MTLAVLYRSGKIPVDKDWFINTVRGFIRAEEASLSNFVLKLSTPVLVLGLRFEIIFSTSELLTSPNEKVDEILCLRNSL